MMADFFASLWLTPPSSAGASSYEDKANSYTYERYSAALQSQVATPRIGDGDARHIAMKIIRMGQGKSISPINSYAKSNKRSLWKVCFRLSQGFSVDSRSPDGDNEETKR